MHCWTASWPAWHVCVPITSPPLALPSRRRGLDQVALRARPSPRCSPARDRDDKPSLGRDHGLISELERSLYTRWCAFCFVRVSMPPPNQTRAYLPCITCCTREKHARAHMRALPPVRSRFCARSIACASLAPRRSLLREVLVPHHHPGHFGYFQLRLRALVASLLHGSVSA